MLAICEIPGLSFEMQPLISVAVTNCLRKAKTKTELSTSISYSGC
jgi:hypothetical protein